MQLTLLSLSFATLLGSVSANSYPINGDGVNCRSGPGTGYAVQRSYNKGNMVTLTCQTNGESVNGDSLWDKTTDGCYVADWYVQTNTGNMVVGSCNGGGGGATYPINDNGVNCRSGPGTGYAVQRSYNKGNMVTLTCQTNGESINGDSLWDKTTDGCYVADWYVQTNTGNMVVGACDGGGGGGGGGAVGSPIKRSDVIARARFWTNKHIPYSQTATSPDPQGLRYRTDCSGFVCMALHASAPGLNTVSLPSISHRINWADLQPGDLVGTLGPGTGGDAGHVTLFLEWVDGSHNSYRSLECNGSDGCVQMVERVGWTDGPFTAQPYRYNNIRD
ncbi:hypothetical protein VHEMI01717 [[Torrubiella] hemipterigena]|uniref:NlpC/P60-like cell-wall peptidase n=1 Tax=[Torrubiella] hemipterigena TaxID=1531966 RepID=A0A0A1T5M7_9HYPO|nr:hypothetical protein VHEMI01717 [[Torrubiella] hemipterigena]